MMMKVKVMIRSAPMEVFYSSKGDPRACTAQGGEEGLYSSQGDEEDLYSSQVDKENLCSSNVTRKTFEALMRAVGRELVQLSTITCHIDCITEFSV